MLKTFTAGLIYNQESENTEYNKYIIWKWIKERKSNNAFTNVLKYSKRNLAKQEQILEYLTLKKTTETLKLKQTKTERTEKTNKKTSRNKM